MSAVLIYSMLMLTTCALAVACTLYATRGDFRPVLNRLFAGLAFAMIVWAMGLMVTDAARTEAVSAIGRRIAPVGWGMIGSVMLHFVLAFTGHGSFLSRRRNVILIHLPGAVVVFAFTVLPLFGGNADALIRTSYGWADTAAPDAWDWYYYAYMAAYLAIGATLLTRWGRHSRSENKRRQAWILTLSFFIGNLMGIAMDALPLLLGIRFPQVSAAFMILPILASGYCISRYRFLQPKVVSQDELILSKLMLTRAYRYLSLGVLFSGVALYFAEPLFGGPFSELPTAWVSLAALACGAFLLALDRMRLDQRLKEMLASVGFALFTPMLAVWFSGVGIPASWTFVFPLMIMSLVFSWRIILSTLIAASILTELFLWTYMPEADLLIFTPDYLIRLGVIAFAAFFSVYVNRSYTRKLRENAGHIQMQAIASEISHSFVSVSLENIGEKLRETLKTCGSFIGCDRAYLVLLEKESHAVRYAVEWISESAAVQTRGKDEDMREIRPELLRQLQEKDVLIVRDARLLPPMAAQVKRRFLAQGIRGLVTVAVKNRGEIIGFMGFSAARPLGKWNLISPDFIRIAAAIIADALIKMDGERALSRMAFHDQLTGLPNRILLKERLDQAIIEAKESGKLVGVTFLDLDAFKAVNDTLGHAQGDKLLVEISRKLVNGVRVPDTVARFGGDEFIVLFNPLKSADEMLPIMDRIMETVRQPVTLAGQEFFVSASAGVALYPEDGEDAESLLKNADTAMYRAKASGKGKYFLCSRAMKDEIQERIRLTNLLYRALENEQLLLHFQPQIEIATQRIVGLEALLRWNLPESGIISPATFIPLAEQTGLIHAIGAWVLEEACRVNRRFHEMGCEGLRMAVNVSVHQLKNPGFAEVVAGALKRTGLPPEFLELEITESVANGNTDGMVEVLQRLKALGVTISIDDFGTQYSSLSRLKVLPIDRIKMDMQFVRGIEKSAKDQAISKVIINLAKSLNLKVIAEGVETAPQLHFLSERRCDEVQGFYYFKPMPAGEVQKLLERQLKACARPEACAAAPDALSAESLT